MKKRILTLILAALAALTLFVSCASCAGSESSGISSSRPIDVILNILNGKNKESEEVIPVEKIEITNKEDDVSSTFGGYVVLELDSDGKAEYQVEYKVYPSNATTSSVSFTIEASPDDCAVIDEKTGLLTFTKEGLVTVYAVADDGSDAQDKFTVICIKNTEADD